MNAIVVHSNTLASSHSPLMLQYRVAVPEKEINKQEMYYETVIQGLAIFVTTAVVS